MDLKKLLVTIVEGLTEHPDEIKVTQDEPNAEGVVVFHLSVAQEDMGRVIGKQGKIAKAIRIVMRSAAAREDMMISVEIE